MKLKNPVLIGFGIKDKSSFFKSLFTMPTGPLSGQHLSKFWKMHPEQEIPGTYQRFYQFPEMKIVIIKYNAGNIRSVLFALERIGAEALVTDDPDLIRSADKIIFPGVGEASSAMHYLRERKLDLLIQNLKQPVLGVCLGMQLLCVHSEENDTECLGVFGEKVKKFIPFPEMTASKFPRWDGIIFMI